MKNVILKRISLPYYFPCGNLHISLLHDAISHIFGASYRFEVAKKLNIIDIPKLFENIYLNNVNLPRF